MRYDEMPNLTEHADKILHKSVKKYGRHELSEARHSILVVGYDNLCPPGLSGFNYLTG